MNFYQVKIEEGSGALVQERLRELKKSLCFRTGVAQGPEIEDCFIILMLYVLTDHPARSEDDTFYFYCNLLLRTQTSMFNQAMETKASFKNYRSR